MASFDIETFLCNKLKKYSNNYSEMKVLKNYLLKGDAFDDPEWKAYWQSLQNQPDKIKQEIFNIQAVIDDFRENFRRQEPSNPNKMYRRCYEIRDFFIGLLTFYRNEEATLHLWTNLEPSRQLPLRVYREIIDGEPVVHVLTLPSSARFNTERHFCKDTKELIFNTEISTKNSPVVAIQFAGGYYVIRDERSLRDWDPAIGEHA